MKRSLDRIEGLAKEREDNDTLQFQTSFAFLRQQNGIRPGKVHVFLAPPGAGKSTLVRSLIWDLIQQFNLTQRIVLWLSEERVIDFAIEFDRIKPEPQFKFCLDIYSEMDSNLDLNEEKKYLDSILRDSDNRIFILDNVTTSKFFADMKPEVQAKFLTYLKRKAIEHNIAIVIIAHTTKMANSGHGMIRMEDTQGTSATAKLAEFFYAIQNIYVKKNQFSVLQVLKSRGQESPDKFFGLVYDRESRIYKIDNIITFDDVGKLWKNRNKLGT
jgi:hypothetical protein